MQTEIEELRRLWDEGLKSGPGNLGSMKAIKAEARRCIEKRDEQEDKKH